MGAEELVGELLGTAPGDGKRTRASCGDDLSQRVNNKEGLQNVRGGNDFSHRLEFTARMSVGAMISRVDVRVGAFGAHPLIYT